MAAKNVQDEPQQLGLRQLYPESSDDEATKNAEIDIVVIHGLSTQSTKTWNAWETEDDPTSKEVNWLRDKDMLPAKMPKSRILTYDWNANYDRSASVKNFLGHADSLLDALYINRHDTERLRIPLIFVASCFGGLLVAQALVRAAESFGTFRTPRTRPTLDYTVGIVFLGTPFGGSWAAGNNAAQMRLAVARSAAEEQGIQYNKELITYLQLGSVDSPGPLDQLVARFTEMVADDKFRIPIACFYETAHTQHGALLKKLPEGYEQTSISPHGHGIVVSQHSACLHGAESIGLDVRHNMMHKFNSPHNPGFQNVVMRISGFAQHAKRTLQKKDQAGLGNEAKKLLAEWRERLIFNEMDRRAQELEEEIVAEGTCQWFYNTEEFQAWVSQCTPGHVTPILVLEGKAGSGKSVIMRDAVSHAQKSPAWGGGVIHVSYFFDANNGTSLEMSRQGLYRSVLFQLLDKVGDPDILYETLKRWNNWDKGIADLIYLQGKIRQVLKVLSENGSRVCLYIDALDECREDAEETFNILTSAIALLEFLEGQRRNGRICLCISTRRRADFRAWLSSATILTVDKHNRADIQKYLDQNFQPPCTPEERATLARLLLHQSSGMFLWVKLVVRRVNTMMLGLTLQAIVKQINDIPSELAKLYRTLLESLEPEIRDEVLILLQLVQVAIRPLTVPDLQSALKYAFDKSKGHEELDTQKFQERILGFCQGLIELKTIGGWELRRHTTSGSHLVATQKLVVQFTHHSVRDFLEEIENGIKAEELIQGASSKPLYQSHLTVARVCLRVVEANDKVSTFGAYAAQFWTTHARKGDRAIDDSSALPRIVTSCSHEHRSMIVRWKELVEGDYSRPHKDREDYSIASDVREDGSLLELLAFEGCTKMLVRHYRECVKKDHCYNKVEVMESAILLAATRGWDDTIRTLLKLARGNIKTQNINVNRPLAWYDDHTPLYTACLWGRKTTVELLLKEGCDILERGQATVESRLQPLHAVIENSDEETLKVILDHACDRGQIESLITDKDTYGNTALYCAAAAGSSRVFSLLLNYIDGPNNFIESCNDIFQERLRGSMTLRDTAVSSRQRVINRHGPEAVQIREYDKIIEKLESLTLDGLDSAPTPQEQLSIPAGPVMNDRERMPDTPQLARSTRRQLQDTELDESGFQQSQASRKRQRTLPPSGPSL